MFSVTTGIHIHFAHHVRGHLGPCISLHGHTWLFEVTLQASSLDHQGFVADFDILYADVLQKCHTMLDHSLALGRESYDEVKNALVPVGEKLVASRGTVHGHLGDPVELLSGQLAGAENHTPGGIKLAVFPFTPTSERIAEWLHQVASEAMADERVSVAKTRIYESLHPAEAFADYSK